MENTAMQKILDAEKKADQIIADGVAKARDISEKSNQELKDMTAAFEEELEEKTAEIMKKHTDVAEKQSRELEVSFSGECNVIKKNAAVNIDTAVDFVIEKMGDGKWQ